MEELSIPDWFCATLRFVVKSGANSVLFGKTEGVFAVLSYEVESNIVVVLMPPGLWVGYERSKRYDLRDLLQEFADNLLEVSENKNPNKPADYANYLNGLLPQERELVSRAIELREKELEYARKKCCNVCYQELSREELDSISGNHFNITCMLHRHFANVFNIDAAIETIAKEGLEKYQRNITDFETKRAHYPTKFDEISLVFNILSILPPEGMTLDGLFFFLYNSYGTFVSVSSLCGVLDRMYALGFVRKADGAQLGDKNDSTIWYSRFTKSK